MSFPVVVAAATIAAAAMATDVLLGSAKNNLVSWGISSSGTDESNDRGSLSCCWFCIVGFLAGVAC